MKSSTRVLNDRNPISLLYVSFDSETKMVLTAFNICLRGFPISTYGILG